MVVWWFTALTLLVHWSTAEECQFPSAVTSIANWETHIKNEHRYSGMYIAFTSSSIEITDYEEDPYTVTSRLCEQDLGNHTYILSQSRGEQTKYMCLKLLIHSPYVLQRMESPLQDNIEDTLCEESNLDLNEWPIVRPYLGDKYQSCGLEGGFNMVLYDESGQRLCQENWLKPRIESECIRGEGITMDFRHPDCKEGLSMKTTQSLSCLGNWQTREYKFMVLTDNRDWPRLWLMRYPRTRGESFTAYILKDLVAAEGLSITTTRLYRRMALSQVNFPSLCENEASNCIECGHQYNFYCQKHCDQCSHLQNMKQCTFEPDTVGEWIDNTAEGDQSIRVTETMLYPQGLQSFRCLDLQTDDWFVGKNRKALASIFQNGCKPRYTCVELERKTASVLQYRLSQSLVWPHTLVINGGDVCPPEQFMDDTPPLLSKLRSHERKNLVIKRPHDYARRTIDCSLPGTFILDAHFQNGENCTGMLTSCTNDDNKMALTLVGCPSIPSRQFLRCMVSYKHSTKVFMITETEDDPDNLSCLMFSEDIYDSTENRVYMMRAGECHKGIIPLIDYRGYQNYIAKLQFYMIPHVDDDCRSAEIPYIPTTTPQPSKLPEALGFDEHLLKPKKVAKVPKNLDKDDTLAEPNPLNVAAHQSSLQQVVHNGTPSHFSSVFYASRAPIPKLTYAVTLTCIVCLIGIYVY